MPPCQPFTVAKDSASLSEPTSTPVADRSVPSEIGVRFPQAVTSLETATGLTRPGNFGRYDCGFGALLFKLTKVFSCNDPERLLFNQEVIFQLRVDCIRPKGKMPLDLFLKHSMCGENNVICQQ